MILTVDIGNTATTMGLYTPEGTLRFRGALKTDKNKNPGPAGHRPAGYVSPLPGRHRGGDRG